MTEIITSLDQVFIPFLFSLITVLCTGFAFEERRNGNMWMAAGYLWIAVLALSTMVISQ